MAIDAEMMRRDVSPGQRTIYVGRLLWEAVGWEGRMRVDDSLADAPGFSGDALMAKAQRWYRHVYGDQLKVDGSIAWIPYVLGNSIWKVRLPVVLGRCNFFMDGDLSNAGVIGFTRETQPSLNVITCIKGVTPGVLSRVKSSEWLIFFRFYLTAFNAMNWLSAMRGCNALFSEGLNDYHTSVNELMERRFSQSRWSSAQAAEKVLKGGLKLAGIPFDTRGPDGHNISKLGSKTNDSLGTSLPGAILSQAHCSPRVRYGEEDSSERQALEANHAALSIITSLGGSTTLSNFSKVQLMDEIPEIEG